MNTLFAKITYKLLLVFMSIAAVFGSPAEHYDTDPIISQRPEEVCLTAVYWGDPQISDYMPARQKSVLAACQDLNGSEVQIDALLLAGDLAENGKPAEYRLLADDLCGIETVNHFVIATGNHDVRLRIFDNTLKTFHEFCNTVDPSIGIEDKLYYTYEINGYTFIVLGTTSSTFEEADIDEEELEWFDSQLDKATADGKPAFVLLHQPLKLTHALPDAWNSPFDWAGSVGDQSDDLITIMNKYDNVFLLTGHLHSGLGEANFENIGNFVSVNVPSIGIVSKDGGYEAAGTGYMIEVYPSSVLFRARDFINGQYMTEFDKNFALK